MLKRLNLRTYFEKMLRKLHSAISIVRAVQNWPLALLDHAAFLKRSYICFEIYIHQCYNLADIRPGATVIDIGANIGCYSLLAAQNAARVLAYEPYPENFSILHKNVALNKASNIETFPYAVAATADKHTLFLPEDDTLVGRISLYSQYGTRTVEVKCVTLDQIIQNERINKIEVLKIDCEGAEYEILYGASPHTLFCIEQIIMECHLLDHQNCSPIALKNYLKNFNFDVQMDNSLLYAHR